MLSILTIGGMMYPDAMKGIKRDPVSRYVMLFVYCLLLFDDIQNSLMIFVAFSALDQCLKCLRNRSLPSDRPK